MSIQLPNCGVLTKQAQWVDVIDTIPSLRAIAGELFASEVEIEFESDPEIPDCHYLVLTVNLTDASLDVSELRRSWYRRTNQLLGENADKVRLSINVASPPT